MKKRALTLNIGRNLLSIWQQVRPQRQAAALAYYSMFSLPPALFLAITFAGLFIEDFRIVEQLRVQLEAAVGPEVTQYLADVLRNVADRRSNSSILTTVISVGAILYAATGLFAQLKYSLNAIWGVDAQPENGILDFILTRLLSFGLVIGVGLLLIAASVASLALSVVSSFLKLDSSSPLASFAILFALLFVAFAVLYKILPDTSVRWREAFLGSLVATLLFTVGRVVIGIYLSISSVGSAFDAAGVLAVLLISVYYGAQIFLFGAIVSRAYDHRHDGLATE